MADTIRMTLRALNWTEGEVGYVHLRMPLLSERSLEYLDRALERNGGTREEDSYLRID